MFCVFQTLHLNLDKTHWTVEMQSNELIVTWLLQWLDIPQKGVQRKQGVVISMTLYTSLLHNTTPIHCTPLRLHPPVMNIHSMTYTPITLRRDESTRRRRRRRAAGAECSKRLTQHSAASSSAFTVHRVPAEGWLGRSVDHFHSMLYCWPRWLDLCEAAGAECSKRI